jgi:Helicase conserved C-terminal domain
MPSLDQSLLAHDIALLRAIAVQAGLDLAAPNARAAVTELAIKLKDPEPLDLLLTRTLRQNNKNESALALLVSNNGRYPVAAFIRKYGDLRPLGPVALTREQPWERPATATEALYYNGLIGRTFMESDTGPQEYFYIPSDLLPLLPALDVASPLAASQAVAPVETDADDAQTGTTVLVDDAVTLLAAVQRYPGEELTPADLKPYLHLPVFDFLTTLLTELGCITPDRKLDPDKVKPFLQASRAVELQTLADGWRSSKTFNDLLRVPSLRPEPGAWHNDPAAARNFILKLCADLPAGEWRSLESFLDFVREHHPDFQRPAGDYDSWYIRDAISGGYLRGFEYWNEVDGALVRYVLTGPMYWLGLVDLRSNPNAFRLTPLFTAFMGNDEWLIPETPAQILCKHDGTLVVLPDVNRFDRFQAARIGEWSPVEPASQAGQRESVNMPYSYHYRVTGTSLQTGADQGITSKQLLAFLRRACDHLPEHIITTIERWGEHGIEARAETLLVLKLKDPELLEKLMRFARTRRWLGEAIGDSAVEVKDLEKLREAMLELGLAVEWVRGD